MMKYSECTASCSCLLRFGSGFAIRGSARDYDCDRSVCRCRSRLGIFRWLFASLRRLIWCSLLFLWLIVNQRLCCQYRRRLPIHLPMLHLLKAASLLWNLCQVLAILTSLHAIYQLVHLFSLLIFDSRSYCNGFLEKNFLKIIASSYSHERKTQHPEPVPR